MRTEPRVDEQEVWGFWLARGQAWSHFKDSYVTFFELLKEQNTRTIEISIYTNAVRQIATALTNSKKNTRKFGMFIY